MKIKDKLLKTAVGLIFMAAMTQADALAATGAELKLSVGPGSIEEPEITLSNCIPIIEQELEFRVVVRNSGKAEADAFEVAFFVSDRNGKRTELAGAQSQNPLAAGDTEVLTTTWKPEQTGFYTFNVVVDPAKKLKRLDRSECKAELEFPVVTRELYFYQSPSDMKSGKARKRRYTSAVVVCDREQIAYWKNRGSKTLKWVSGFHSGWLRNLITKRGEDALSEVVSYWGKFEEQGFDGISIDEFGEPYDEAGIKKMKLTTKALIELHRQKPNLEIFPSECGRLYRETVSGYRASGSIVMLECYENWLSRWAAGPHRFYDYLDRKIEDATDLGLIRKKAEQSNAIFLLGVEGVFGGNVPGQIEDAVRYIKRKAPSMPGISFWSAGNAYQFLEDTGLDKLLDQLCLKYYIMPVITVGENDIWLSDYAPKTGEELELFVRVHNIGAMDADDVRARVHVREMASGKRIFSSAPVSIKLGVGYVEPEIKDKSRLYEMQEINGTMYPVFDNEKQRYPYSVNRIYIDRNRFKIKWTPPRGGAYQIEVEIIPSSEYTVLDGFAVKDVLVSN